MRQHIFPVEEYAMADKNSPILGLARTLRAAREEKGLTQSALSEKVGMPQSHISKIENGAVDLQASSLLELARVLDLEVALIPKKLVPAIRGLERNSDPKVQRMLNKRLAEMEKRSRLIMAKSLDPALLWEALELLRKLRPYPLSTDEMHGLGNFLARMKPVLNKVEDADSKGVPVDTAVYMTLQEQLKTLRRYANAVMSDRRPEDTERQPAYRLTDDDDG
jgi:transcriptional regulator with XRE-family HTH domain